MKTFQISSLYAHTILTFLLFCSLNVLGQMEGKTQQEQAIRLSIQNLFDGMREADSAKVSSAFVADAEMISISTNAAGETLQKKGDLNRFLDLVHNSRPHIWDERIRIERIEIDGSMAQVWCAYAFYLDDQFSHCGVNAFTLVKTDGNWKIRFLSDTRRKTACPEL